MKKKHLISNYNRENLLVLSLCMLLFYMVLGSSQSSFLNAFFVFKLEVVFCLLYFFILNSFPPLREILQENKLVAIIFLLWGISLIYSFYSSPLPLQNDPISWLRLYTSFGHVLFFFFLWDFFKRYSPSIKYIFYTITFSTLIVVIYSIYYWQVNPWIEASVWFNEPPLNSHIRHTGYEVEASICFFVFLLLGTTKEIRYLYQIFILTILLTFLFWLGGRGAILSLFATFLGLIIILKYKQRNSYRFILIILWASLFAIFISDYFSIFSWNGLLSSINRSLEADSLNQLSSSRISLWISTIESLQGNLLFGLGPQSYALMPNHIYGVHPHNVLLQFLIEWGLVGTLLFLFLLIRAFWTGIKLHILDKETTFNKYALSVGAVISTLSINAFIDGTYYHPQPSVYLAIAFSIWILPNQRKDYDKE